MVPKLEAKVSNIGTLNKQIFKVTVKQDFQLFLSKTSVWARNYCDVTVLKVWPLIGLFFGVFSELFDIAVCL